MQLTIQTGNISPYDEVKYPVRAHRLGATKIPKQIVQERDTVPGDNDPARAASGYRKRHCRRVSESQGGHLFGTHVEHDGDQGDDHKGQCRNDHDRERRRTVGVSGRQLRILGEYVILGDLLSVGIIPSVELLPVHGCGGDLGQFAVLAGSDRSDHACSVPGVEGDGVLPVDIQVTILKHAGGPPCGVLQVLEVLLQGSGGGLGIEEADLVELCIPSDLLDVTDDEGNDPFGTVLVEPEEVGTD